MFAKIKDIREILLLCNLDNYCVDLIIDYYIVSFLRDIIEFMIIARNSNEINIPKKINKIIAKIDEISKNDVMIKKIKNIRNFGGVWNVPKSITIKLENNSEIIISYFKFYHKYLE